MSTNSANENEDVQYGLLNGWNWMGIGGGRKDSFDLQGP